MYLYTCCKSMQICKCVWVWGGRVDVCIPVKQALLVTVNLCSGL